MKKIILEHRFTGHQKITFLLYLGAPFIIGIFLLLRINPSLKDYLAALFFFICYVLLLIIAFLKRGFIKIDSKLYIGSFFLGRLFFKKQIAISETPKITILSFRKSQKYAWFSDAKPDLGFKYNSFEINILNSRHTKRQPILTLKKQENAKSAIDFLSSNFDLKYEKYNPNFRRGVISST